MSALKCSLSLPAVWLLCVSDWLPEWWSIGSSGYSDRRVYKPAFHSYFLVAVESVGEKGLICQIFKP